MLKGQSVKKKNLRVGECAINLIYFPCNDITNFFSYTQWQLRDWLKKNENKQKKIWKKNLKLTHELLPTKDKNALIKLVRLPFNLRAVQHSGDLSNWPQPNQALLLMARRKIKGICFSNQVRNHNHI